MGKFIGVRAGKLVEKDGRSKAQNWVSLVQIEEKEAEQRLFEVIRKKEEEQRLFEVNTQEICSNCSKQAKATAGEEMDFQDKKGDKEQYVRWKAWW